MSRLEQLLRNQVSTDSFINDYWSKKHLHIKNKEGFKTLFSWDAFNFILNTENLSHQNVRFISNGELVSPIRNQGFYKVDIKAPNKELFFKTAKSGATLILDAVHNKTPELQQFTADLSSELGELVGINAYCSYPSKLGFNVHSDMHDVIILQIEGQKKWELYEDTSRLSEPTHIYNLNPGDFLYIPKGLHHCTKTIDSASLHLTIGVYAKTMEDLAKWLVKEALKDPSLPEKLPARVQSYNSNKIGYDQSQLSHYFSKIRNAIDTVLDSPNLEYKFNRDMIASDKIINPFNFPFTGALNKISFSPETHFFRKPNLRLFMEKTETEIVIYALQKTFRFSLEIDKIIEYIISCEHFTGTMLLDLDATYEWTSLEPFLFKLIDQGLIYTNPQHLS